MVSLAALSVQLALRLKSRRRRRIQKSYQEALAARDPEQSGAILVPFPSPRRSTVNRKKVREPPFP